MNAKHWLLTSALLTCAVSAEAEMRVFTDTRGRTMKAEIVSASPQKVTVKLESGATADVPLNSLSKSDQEFVNTWRIYVAPTLAAPVSPVDFGVSWTKDRDGGRVRPVKDVRYAVEKVGEEWLCNFKVTNPTRSLYENVRMEYQVFVRWGKGGARPGPSGSVNLPSIGAFQTATVKTTVFKLAGTAKQNYGEVMDKDGKIRTVKIHQTIEMEEIAGVSLIFKKDGVELDRWESPGLK